MKSRQLLNRRAGFTLIEIMMALTLFAAVFGPITVLLVDALAARKAAADLNQAVILARQTMDGIKSRRETGSDHGDFPAFPGYSFEYEIKEIEIDLASLSEKTGGAISIDDEQTKLLKERGGNKETVTGGIFKMLEYDVKVFYGVKKNYSLKYFRGLGI